MTQEDYETIARLMQSETMSRISFIEQDMPLDANTHGGLKEAFATSLKCLVDALDNDRISFTQAQDKALLFWLMAAALRYVTKDLQPSAPRSRLN